MRWLRAYFFVDLKLSQNPYMPTTTTIEKREEQDESIALKDVVFQKGNFNNCTINVTVSKKE